MEKIENNFPNGVDDAIITCTNCGAINDDDAKFCEFCGEKLERKPSSAIEADIFCIYCGKKMAKGAAFCIYCGKPSIKNAVKSLEKPENEVIVEKNTEQLPQPQPVVQRKVTNRCPKCGSKQCHPVNKTNVSSSGGGYSCCLGLGGAICAGPLGLLFGLCGSSPTVHTSNQMFWACQDCGFEFRSREEMVKNVNSIVRGIYIVLISIYALFFVDLILLLADQMSCLALLEVMWVIVAFVLWLYIPKMCENNSTPVSELMREENQNRDINYWDDRYRGMGIAIGVTFVLSIIAVLREFHII